MAKWWAFFWMVSFTGCASGPQEQAANQNTQRFQFTVTQYAEIGYGSVYTIETKENKPRILALTVMVGEAGEFPDLHFGSLIQTFEGTFVFKENNAPYRTMPITGFVDEDKKIWKLVELKHL